ncbi:MAG: preprotein translocase subunit YajC [Gammaproteobacteria bacterium]|nr:preprotein translocase subunit YajC [Gammaproteobacteria bacterium]
MDWSLIIFLVAMIAIFYFLIFRPQSKRRKEQQALMASLSAGDEVVSIGGIMGEIASVEDDWVFVKVADKVELRIQKGSIGATLPKGTLSGLPAQIESNKKG